MFDAATVVNSIYMYRENVCQQIGIDTCPCVQQNAREILTKDYSVHKVSPWEAAEHTVDPQYSQPHREPTQHKHNYHYQHKRGDGKQRIVDLGTVHLVVI